MREVDALVEAIAAKVFVEGTECKVVLKSRRCAMPRVERNLELLYNINKIFEEAGMPLLEESFRRSGSDAADVTEYGVPCLDGFGVEGFGIHRREEFAHLASLKEAARRMAVIACDI